MNDLTKQLVCKLFPPQNVFVMTAQGPALAGSGPAVVQENAWCFQFQRAESSAEIESESAPNSEQKLLTGAPKTILNG